MNSLESLSVQSYRRATFVLFAAILLGSLVGIMIPAGLGWDFANFYDTGKRVAAGQQEDIYHPTRLINGMPPQGSLAFWGTPLSAWLYVPLSAFSPTVALIIFKIQNTIAYYCALGILFLLTRQWVDQLARIQWKFAAQFLGICLLFQPIWTVYRVGGQTTPTVLLLLSLGLLFHLKDRQFLTALCLVIAVMIKPAFIIGVALLMLISGLRFFFVTASVFCGAGVLSLAIMGPELHYEFIVKMLEGAKITYPWMFNSSLYVLVEHMRLFNEAMVHPWVPSQVFPWLFLLLKICILGMFSYLIFRSHKKINNERAFRHYNFLMAFTFTLMIAQTVWEHYLAVLILLLVYLLTFFSEMTRMAKGLFAGIIVLSIGQNLIFIHVLESLFDFSGIVPVILACLFKSLPLMLTLVFLLVYHEDIFSSYLRNEWRHRDPGDFLGA